MHQVKSSTLTLGDNMLSRRSGCGTDAKNGAYATALLSGRRIAAAASPLPSVTTIEAAKPREKPQAMCFERPQGSAVAPATYEGSSIADEIDTRPAGIFAAGNRNGPAWKAGSDMWTKQGPRLRHTDAKGWR